MATKATFTPDEWARIMASPIVAGIAITAADPGGLWSMLKEALASGWALLDVKKDPNADPLVKAVADDLGDPTTRDALRHSFEGRFKGSELSSVPQKAIEELRAVAGLLDAKAPEDAPAFKAWLRQVAQQTAEAGKEGGFFGFGGVKVSDAEKATLSEIDAALSASGVPAGIAET
ncbi:hypothetical protein [Microvirga puerhi]|uniref:Uncharacterized protein n=1 Tax=Microvirga puerhi TaxID=2876078 RepID=A0ABS7VID6_9HYPH|nr:hypothetical protein [Microvirga puerhi]MBZ6074738.1 hypothetical protein [Microvirga puerhi]